MLFVYLIKIMNTVKEFDLSEMMITSGIISGQDDITEGNVEKIVDLYFQRCFT